MRDDPLSIQECEFYQSSFRENSRLDDRSNLDHRDLSIMFGKELGTCFVTLGNTKILAKAVLSWGPTRENRKSSGFIEMFISKGNLGSSKAEPSKLEGRHLEMLRCLECVIRDTDCVDVDSLCIRIKETCLQLRIDIHIIDDFGGLCDAGSIAVIGALKHCYVPLYETTAECDFIYNDLYKYGKPLTVFHTPIATTFGLWNDTGICVVDPTNREEMALDGQLVVSVNDRSEVCGIYQINQIDINVSKLSELVKIAEKRTKYVNEVLNKALLLDATNRKLGVSVKPFHSLIDPDSVNTFVMK
uniref:Exosome complex component RRP45 n=1 Tax=Strongyloides papillosus TaxID=174720 RepID=A0A0N5B6F5_STREA